jgi:vacuolar-type H+-ATPase subunit F/Vma7
LGDEVTAAGFRLAGVQALAPDPSELLENFHRALQETDLLLLSVEVARILPHKEVNAAVAGLRPLVLVLPDIRRRFVLRDLQRRLAGELGIR